MDRRAFLGTLAGGLLASPLAAEAQPTGKVPRVPRAAWRKRSPPTASAIAARRRWGMTTTYMPASAAGVEAVVGGWPHLSCPQGTGGLQRVAGSEAL